MKESALEKEFLIFLILSEKKSQSIWQDPSESHEKEVPFQEQSVRPASVSLNHEYFH